MKLFANHWYKPIYIGGKLRLDKKGHFSTYTLVSAETPAPPSSTPSCLPRDWRSWSPAACCRQGRGHSGSVPVQYQGSTISGSVSIQYQGSTISGSVSVQYQGYTISGTKLVK